MFRWKRALLHALISFVVVFAGGFVLFAVVPSLDPNLIGGTIGRFAVYTFFASIGISYLAQTGRRRAALLVGVGFVVATVGVFLLGFFVGPLVLGQRATPFTADDHASLVEVYIGGERHLKHPTLGFSILRPPPSYSPSPQMAAAMKDIASDPHGVTYAYTEEPPRGALLVMVINNLGSRRDFQRFLDRSRGDLERSVKSHLGESATVQVVRNDVTGDDAHPEAHLHTVASGVHTQLTAYALHVPERSPMLVAVMVISPDATMMADVLASFRP